MPLSPVLKNGWHPGTLTPSRPVVVRLGSYCLSPQLENTRRIHHVCAVNTVLSVVVPTPPQTTQRLASLATLCLYRPV